MRLSAIFLLLFSLFYVDVVAQSTTLLKGKVVGLKSASLYLLPRTQTTRSDQKIEIPIKNGEFEYSLEHREVEAYELIFRHELEQGSWRPILFFPDSSSVTFTLYPMDEADHNKVTGGGINRSYYQLKTGQQQRFGARQEQLYKIRNQLSDRRQYHSPAQYALQDKARKAKDVAERQACYEQMNQLEKANKHLGTAGLAWNKRNDSLQQQIINWKYTQLKSDVNFAHFYSLFEDVMYHANDNPLLAKPIRDTYQAYANAYPQHSYTKPMLDRLNGLLRIFPGNPYLEFTADDLQGTPQQIAGFLKGKMVLIDFWGSWCAPCIAKSRKVVPLYEKYHQKGFTVVGVAREYDNTNALQRQLKIDQFPWPQLLELDNKYGIWNKYGVQNNAGLFLLLDENGKIISVDPTIEQLTAQLAQLD